MQPTRFLHPADGATERLSGFMAHLRSNGMMNGFSQTDAALRALDTINAMNIEEVRLSLKAICARDEEKFARFDDLFTAYWLNRGLEREQFQPSKNNKYVSGSSNHAGRTASGSSSEDGEAEAPDEGGEGGTSSRDGRLQASRTTTIEKTDFRKLMTPQDLDRAMALAERLARAIRDRRSRRRKAAKGGAGPRFLLHEGLDDSEGD